VAEGKPHGGDRGSEAISGNQVVREILSDEENQAEALEDNRETMRKGQQKETNQWSDGAGS